MPVFDTQYWKEIADTAIRERDEARKALKAVNATAALNRDFNKYMIEPHALEMVEAALRRARTADGKDT